MQGGFECTKNEISSISEEGITERVEELRNESGVQNFVVYVVCILYLITAKSR